MYDLFRRRCRHGYVRELCRRLRRLERERQGRDDQLTYGQKVKRRVPLGEGLLYALYALYGTAGMAATVTATRLRH
ncbi:MULTISPECIES: hypothetical protein [unclassified Streptomyces]|uniref:hypothetical protein n=1 Tax=unclassified Streptomyces TaxID=2593676 RepID=UPI002E33C958|nr:MULTISPECIES: hypothetical protein [unclassified Streptomyces]